MAIDLIPPYTDIQTETRLTVFKEQWFQTSRCREWNLSYSKKETHFEDIREQGA
jgi:hypothetical protein